MPAWMNKTLLFLFLALTAFQLSQLFRDSVPLVSEENNAKLPIEEEQSNTLEYKDRIQSSVKELARLFAWTENVKQVILPEIIPTKEPVQPLLNPRWLVFLGQVTVKDSQTDYIFKNANNGVVFTLSIEQEKKGRTLDAVTDTEFILNLNNQKIILQR